MNQREKIIQEMQMKRFLLHRSRIHEGCVRINAGNTYEHELRKFNLCWTLLKDGQSFITEAEFESGGRCDVFSLSEELIYEVVSSESDASIEEKRKKYPVRIVVIRA